MDILIENVPEEDLGCLETSYIDLFDATNPKKGTPSKIPFWLTLSHQ